MAESSSFFNAVINNGVPDRVYKADNFADFFSSLIKNGIFPNPSTNLQVVGVNNNMSINIKSGRAWINGYSYNNTEDLTLSISNADGVLNRIDRVVVRLDFLNREIKSYVKKGTFATNPIPPDVNRASDIYELAIADVSVRAGSIKITQANITDLRLNSNLCGVVKGTVDEIDTTTLYSKLEGYIEERGQDVDAWVNQATATWGDEFNRWFDGIKDILGDDVAGALANRILELETKVNNLDLVASKVTMVDGSTVEDAINLNKANILEIEKELGASKTILESNVIAIRQVL